MGFVNSIVSRTLTGACAYLPPEDVADAIKKGVAQRPDALQLQESLLVRLTNMRAPTMFGEEVVDTLPGANTRQRLSYHITPYAQMSGGAACAVVATDENKETYVLIGKRLDGSAWTLPGGFMDVKHGASAQGVTTENEHARDRYEDEYLAKGTPMASKPIERLTTKAHSYDRTMEDTAVRELREETGVVVGKDQLDLVLRATNDKTGHGAAGDQPYQQQENIYLVDLRAHGKLPAVQETDDLKDPEWVKLSDIVVNKSSGKLMLSYQNLPIVDHGGLEKSVGHMRDKEIMAFGVTPQHVQSLASTAKPESEFSAGAKEWHESAITIASDMNKKLIEYSAARASGAGQGLNA